MTLTGLAKRLVDSREERLVMSTGYIGSPQEVLIKDAAVRRTVVSSVSSNSATTPSHNFISGVYGTNVRRHLSQTSPMMAHCPRPASVGPDQAATKLNQWAIGASTPCSARKGFPVGSARKPGTAYVGSFCSTLGYGGFPTASISIQRLIAAVATSS
jgi:hypothetical protein